MVEYGRRRARQFPKFATWSKAILEPGTGRVVGVGDRDYADKGRRRPFKKQARADGKREIERQCREMGS